jgi:hypothetical protein
MIDCRNDTDNECSATEQFESVLASVQLRHDVEIAAHRSIDTSDIAA